MGLISVEQAAGMLGVSRTTAYRMVSDHLIPSVRMMKRGVRVHEEQLQQMIDQAAAASISGAGGISEVTECPTKEMIRPIGGSLSNNQMARELDALLELPISRRQKR
ncbi:helix-turn-helix domain-containing protein [Pseudomonas gingeri]|uniref:helix-turn-helix domain-containing protein n=1 Tax=Pseudomonas gingeri TaxID=117681 RepID=UPI0015BF1965|nr:helix-turn-helix domain-containing protein [Pseudomonas gingeri]